MRPSSAVLRRSTRQKQNLYPEDISVTSTFIGTEFPKDEITNDSKSWSCDDEYKYPLRGSLVDHWEQCYNLVGEFDKDLIRSLKDEISSLLVVASLFLAIVTAFVLESAKWLKAEPPERPSDLLHQLVQLINTTNFVQSETDSPVPFIPDPDIITINQLWFLSMTQSLAAVVLGTLCLQWLSAFERKLTSKTYDKALALRKLRYDGFIGWGVPRVPAILLLNVQGALVLFAFGLLSFLWTVNRSVAFPVAIVAGVTSFLLILTTMLPLLQSVVGWINPRSLRIPQCPFKSPISFAVHRIAVALAIIGSFLVQKFVGSEGRERIQAWREEQIPLLTDYLWEEYDELWRRKCEEEDPWADNKENNKHYSHYLAHGLASVMREHILKPSAVHIVHKCLQDIHGSKTHAKTFRKLFQKDFTKDEEELLATGSIRGEDMFTLRKDFLSSHVLQTFVDHNDKLHDTVLKHRVELFIRVNNTVITHRVEVGKTIKCPIISQYDAASLAMETRRQFLECVTYILHYSRLLCSNELSAVRDTIKSIDPQANISDRFLDTVENLTKELNFWAAKSGDTATYELVRLAILTRFPQMKIFFEDQYSDVGSYEGSELEFEPVQFDDREKWEGNGHRQDTSESCPLMAADDERRRGSE